jgi:hypothetical protein
MDCGAKIEVSEGDVETRQKSANLVRNVTQNQMALNKKE